MFHQVAEQGKGPWLKADRAASMAEPAEARIKVDLESCRKTCCFSGWPLWLK